MSECEDIRLLSRLNGLHLALLDKDESAAFNRLCAAGLASKSYCGPAGFLGLAKVKIKEAS